MNDDEAIATFVREMQVGHIEGIYHVDTDVWRVRFCTGKLSDTAYIEASTPMMAIRLGVEHVAQRTVSEVVGVLGS